MAKKSKVHATIADMNAKEELYGGRLTKARVLRILAGYEIGIAGFAALLYGPVMQHLWCILIWMLIVAFYIYRRLLPRKIESDYQRRSELERNRFINVVTQGMSTKNANIISVLRNATKKAEGEFRDDLSALLAVLVSAPSYKEQHEAFERIQKKYASDIYFTLFMEQVETVVHESIYHIETFRTFEDSHNKLLLKEKEFIQKKKGVQTIMFFMCGVAAFTAGACLMAQGYKEYLKVYALNPIGMGISTFYLFVFCLIIASFYRNFYDDTITSY